MANSFNFGDTSDAISKKIGLCVTWGEGKKRGNAQARMALVILLFGNMISKGHCLPRAEQVALGVKLRQVSPSQQHKFTKSIRARQLSRILLFQDESVKRERTCNI